METNPQHIIRSLGTTGTNGIAFTNLGEEKETANVNVGGRKGRKDKPEITCFNCGMRGYYSNECDQPDKRAAATDQTGTQMLMSGMEEYEQSEFQFHQQGVHTFDNSDTAYLYHQGDKLPQDWVLLDNQSTVDVFSNPRLLKNIRKTTRTMTIKCNAGITETNMIGEMPGYPGEVWYNPKGMANILSVANVKKHYRITYDSLNQNGFIVHKTDGKQRHFKESAKGLFYLDTSIKPTDEAVLVTTVEQNKSSYNVRDYHQAQLARKIQDMIGRPSTKDFIKIVQRNLLPNCPISAKDILAAEDIFGPNLGSLKGKTVCKRDSI